MAAVLSFGGCAATGMLLSKRDLDVQSRTSTAIFVDPVAREKRTIFLDIKSGVEEFDRRAFKEFVSEQFGKNDNGYKLVDDPNYAQFQMVAYVLTLEKASPTAAEQALRQGYLGQAVVAGAATGGLVGRSGRSMVAGGLAGGVSEHVSGSLVKDVTYLLVCDVQIKERAAGGVVVQKDTSIDTRVSDSGLSRQTVSEATDRKEYRTRIVTTANKANLDLAEAQPAMFRKTGFAMSGFF